MSAANAVRSIRNDVPQTRTTLREQMRGNESLLEEYQAAEGSLESLVKPLSARQQTAINLLSLGKSAIATAKTIGISESTLHRWKATHPLFKAELGRRQHDLFDGMVTRLRMSMSNAIDELNSILTGDRSDLRRDAMWQMLKLLKPQKYLVPDEPSTMQAVLDEQIRDERAQRGEIPEAPIDDEQRAAAIPEEYRVYEDVKHQGHEGHEEDRGVMECAERESRESHFEETPVQMAASEGHAERTREASGSIDQQVAKSDFAPSRRQKTTPLPSREGSQKATGATEWQRAKLRAAGAPQGQILRFAQDDGSAQGRHVERSETSGPSERRASSNCAPSSARQEPTHLPSREGPGEGAATDKVEAVDKGRVDGETVSPPCAASANPANADHTPSITEKFIAPRPLPQGEGSQNAARPTDRQVATSESIDAPKGPILRFAQNDESGENRPVDRSESPITRNSPAKPADSRTS